VKDHYNEFLGLIEKLEKAWANNNINEFMNTTHRMNVCFSSKLQEVIDSKEITVTIYVTERKAEETFLKLNEQLANTIKERMELEDEVEALAHMEHKLRLQNESNNNS